MKTDKILFLDIDGVLNRRPTESEIIGKCHPGLTHEEFLWVVEGLSPMHVKRLKDLIDLIGDLKIVFSTTWRLLPDHPIVGEDWRKTLAEMLECDSARFIGDTPYISTTENRRGKEILKWLTDNAQHDSKWCILDDNHWEIEKVVDADRCFFTDERIGLTDEIVDKIINYFN